MGCCALFQRITDGRFLMMLRDDKPNIFYPNCWDFPGGTIEADETPEASMRRELEEEIGYQAPSLRLVFSIYPPRAAPEHFFVVPLTKELSELKLGEGQRLEFFSVEEMENLSLAFWGREIMPLLRRFVKEAPQGRI